MEDNAIDLSIVIPVLNEERNIGPLIEALWEVVRGLEIPAEIVVVDGGSKDRTWAAAERAGARCLLQQRAGYAGALQDGLNAARGRYVATLDGDLSHPAALLAEMWKLRHRADIVVASRFVAGGSSRAPVTRHVLSRVLNGVFSWTLSLPVRDLSSGYRLYRRCVLARDAYRSWNFSILQEILVVAYCDGYSIHEVPLEYRERASGTSHVSVVRFAASYLPTLYRLWKLRNLTRTADCEYRAYSSRHLLQRYWIRKRLSLIARFVDGGQSVLDVGSGSNYLAATRREFVSVEPEPAKVRFLSRRGAKVVEGSAEALPFPDGSFDRVILSHVLPCVEHPTGILQEVHRILENGGRAVVCVPDANRFAWRMVRVFYDRLPNVRASGVRPHRRFSRAEVVDLLESHGFRERECRYVCGAEAVVLLEKT
ncbi:MAG: glycosyltransferase [Bryobacterales bacterium]|nr:glycosyltransferase [Bryobacterales bacterium]